MNSLKYVVLTLVMATTLACSDSSDSPPQVAALLASYILSSEDSIPEGVTFDPVKRAFYATSLQGGSITRIDADGAESLFREADNRAQILGAKVDARARRLWVCAQQVDGQDNRVWVYDLDSRELQMEFLLGALTTDASCNDLDLDDDGVAYVTDPSNPFIYRLDPVSEEGEVLATDPLFNDITGLGLGLNGIAVTGDALLVARFLPPAILRVSLPLADSIAALALSGDTLPSPDGLALLDGDLYAVSDASVSRLRLDAAGTGATVVNRSQVSGLSTATVAEGSLYVIKSEVTRFFVNQDLQLPFEIFQVDLAAFDQ